MPDDSKKSKWELLEEVVHRPARMSPTHARAHQQDPKNLRHTGEFTVENIFSPGGEAMRPDDLDAVQISGNVTLATAFGLFLDVKGRRLFIPYAMLPRNRRFKPGENVTIRLIRDFLKQQGFPDL